MGDTVLGTGGGGRLRRGWGGRWGGRGLGGVWGGGESGW